MPSEDLIRAISLARSGEKDSARHILLKIVEEEPHNEMAWIWLVDTMPTDAERIVILKQCLHHIPNSKIATKALAAIHAHQESEQVSEDGEPAPAEPEAPETQPKEGSGEPEIIQEIRSLEEEPPGATQPLELPELENFAAEAGEEPQELAPTPPSPAAPAPAGNVVDDVISVFRTTPEPGQDASLTAAQATPTQPAKPGRGNRRFWLWAAGGALILVLLVVAFLITRNGLFQASPGAHPTLEPLVTVSSAMATQTRVVDLTNQAPTSDITPTTHPTELPPGFSLDSSELDSLFWSSDGQYIIASTPAGTSLYKTSDYSQAQVFELTGAHNFCSLSPDDHYLVCGGNQLIVWDFSQGSLVNTFTPDNSSGVNITALAISPNGDQVALAIDQPSPQIIFWSLSANTHTGVPVSLQATATALAFSGGSGNLVILLADGELVEWHAPGSEVDTFEQASAATTNVVDFALNDNLLAVAGADQKITLISLETGQPVGSLALSANVHALAFSPDGNKLAIGQNDGQILFWNVIDQGSPDSLGLLSQPVSGLAFSTDGTQIAAAFANGVVAVAPLP